jgi:hypothetical protein
MRHFWKAPLAILSLTAFVGLAGCVQPYDDGYGYAGYGGGYDDYGYDAPGGVGYDYASGGYCDAWGCPADYYDMPLYYGSIYYGGSWFNGPHYYRDYGGSRQYWVHGGWHNDGWSGARPNWYRPGRTGPALGRDFYRSERFRNSRNAGQRDNRGGRPDFNRNDNNRNGNRDFGNRGGRDGGNRNAGPQSQAAPQAQPQNGGAAFRNGRFLPRSEAGNRGGGPRNSGGNRGGGGGNRGGGGDHDGGDGHRGR